MEQRIIDLYDSFTHGFLSRRDFMDRLTEVAGSTAAAVAILPLAYAGYRLRNGGYALLGGLTLALLVAIEFGLAGGASTR